MQSHADIRYRTDALIRCSRSTIAASVAAIEAGNAAVARTHEVLVHSDATLRRSTESLHHRCEPTARLKAGVSP